MSDIEIIPCTPEQRKDGWSEKFSFNCQDYPAGWEVSPSNDIYSLGSVYAEVIPVYVVDNLKHRIDWWVRINENKVELSPGLFPSSENEWIRLKSLSDLDMLVEDWQWSNTCLENFRLQKASMQRAQKDWDMDFTNTSIVLAPSSILLMDIGLNKYKPCILKGVDAQNYIRLSNEKKFELDKETNTASRSGFGMRI